MMEGFFRGSIEFNKNPDFPASAHFYVRSGDGHVGQLVKEDDAAFHAGNLHFTQTYIGIEHEGFGVDPRWFTDAMYRSSARLAAYLCDKYDIPVDREHIIAHSEVPHPTEPGKFGGEGQHQDPGPNFDWDRYMALVERGWSDRKFDERFWLASTPGAEGDPRIEGMAVEQMAAALLKHGIEVGVARGQSDITEVTRISGFSPRDPENPTEFAEKVSLVVGEAAADHVHEDVKGGLDMGVEESDVVRVYVPGTDYARTLRCLRGAGKALAGLHGKNAEELDHDFVRLFECYADEEMMERAGDGLSAAPIALPTGADL